MLLSQRYLFLSKKRYASFAKVLIPIEKTSFDLLISPYRKIQINGHP